MRDYLILLPLVILFLVIKSTIFYWLPVPDLLLILVFHLSITRPTATGVMLTFLLGYISDAFNGSIMGVTSFSLIIVYLATYMFSHKLEIKSRNSQTITLGVFALTKGLIVFYFMSDLVEFDTIYKTIIPTALITGLFSPVILPALSKLDNRFDLNKFKGSLH